MLKHTEHCINVQPSQTKNKQQTDSTKIVGHYIYYMQMHVAI